jgi:alpha-tubulin suppressor-like RCC1 family protein
VLVSREIAVTGATAVSAGFDHSCAVIDGGQVTCWGNNEYRQLGIDTTADRSSTPVLVPGVTGATAVTAGDGSSCALIERGRVTCWGDAYDSEELETSTSKPVLVPGVTGATAVTAGVESSCALLGGGQITCWVQVGGTPVTVSGLAEATAVAAGTNQVCALIAGGQVACWGENEYGELGGVDPLDPSDVGDSWSSTPVLVSGVTRATAVAAGQNHSCAVIPGGQVTCWGYNSPTPLMVAADPRRP